MRAASRAATIQALLKELVCAPNFLPAAPLPLMEKGKIREAGMLLATTHDQFHDLRLKDALERSLRPAVGLDRPSDVLKDPDLDYQEKRAILSSWASDASAVRDRPAMRWLLGAPAPVPLAEVLEALARLDRQAGRSTASDAGGRS